MHPARQTQVPFEQTLPLDGIPADLVMTSVVGPLPDSVVGLIRLEVARALVAWSDSGRVLDHFAGLAIAAEVRRWFDHESSEAVRSAVKGADAALYVAFDATYEGGGAKGSFVIAYRRRPLEVRAVDRRHRSGYGLTDGVMLGPPDLFLRGTSSDDW